MASMHNRETGDANAAVPPGSDIRHEGERSKHTNTNSPQQHATRRNGNISAEFLENSGTNSAGTNSTGQERQPIREASPFRPQLKAAARGTSRSRKNSQDLSPTRNAINTYLHPVPSAAAVQRALSANKPPPQSPGIDNSTPEIRSPKSADPAPRWPVSPRLTSPPPSIAPRNSTHPIRKHDNDMAAANSSQKRLSASVPDLSINVGKSLPEKEDNLVPRSGLKTPARGVSGVASTLETVAENSVPDTPSVVPPSAGTTATSPHDYTEPQDERPQDTQSKSATGSGESESDNAGAKVKPDVVTLRGKAVGSQSSSSLAKRSLTNLASGKSKIGDPPTRSMTVETETVSSVPQAPLNMPGDRGASGKLDANGSLRLKASNETMKPKREKKKNARRPTSINTGTSRSRLST
jgi:Vacuolar segregation subunit 7